jgi:hypothetical protein
MLEPPGTWTKFRNIVLNVIRVLIRMIEGLLRPIYKPTFYILRKSIEAIGRVLVRLIELIINTCKFVHPYAKTVLTALRTSLRTINHVTLRPAYRSIRFVLEKSLRFVRFALRQLKSPVRLAFDSASRAVRFVLDRSRRVARFAYLRIRTPVRFAFARIRGALRFVGNKTSAAFRFIGNRLSPILRSLCNGVSRVARFGGSRISHVLRSGGNAISRAIRFTINHIETFVRFTIDQLRGPSRFIFNQIKTVARFSYDRIANFLTFAYNLVKPVGPPIRRSIVFVARWTINPVVRLLVRILKKFFRNYYVRKPIEMFFRFTTFPIRTLFRFLTQKSRPPVDVRITPCVSAFGPPNNETYVLNDQQQYSIILQNKTVRSLLFDVTIDYEPVGKFVVFPFTTVAIEHPISSPGRFTFIVDRNALDLQNEDKHYDNYVPPTSTIVCHVFEPIHLQAIRKSRQMRRNKRRQRDEISSASLHSAAELLEAEGGGGEGSDDHEDERNEDAPVLRPGKTELRGESMQQMRDAGVYQWAPRPFITSVVRLMSYD